MCLSVTSKTEKEVRHRTSSACVLGRDNQGKGEEKRKASLALEERR